MKIIEYGQYVVSEIKKRGDDRKWWRGRVNERINSPLQRQFRPRSDATHVVDQDWDVLVVLDATRQDLFSERTVNLGIDFSESEIQSKGSSTREWLDQNFTKEYGDIVYVTGNPQVTKYKPNRFHKLINVWQDAFDEDNLTIPAKAVTDSAIRAREEYPNKRLIVHYVQPHEPFIGHPELNFFSWDEVFPSDSECDHPNKNTDFEGTAFGAIYQGYTTSSEVWKAYRENLDYVLKDLKRLIKKLNCKVVITSDHGNAFPRFSWPVPVRVWSHPPGLRHRELIVVPWLEIKGSDRPRIVDDGITLTTDYDDDELTQTLAQLGYR